MWFSISFSLIVISDEGRNTEAECLWSYLASLWITCSLKIFSLRSVIFHFITLNPTGLFLATLKQNKKSSKRPEEILIRTPSDFPDPNKVQEFFQPMIMATILSPSQFEAEVSNLCMVSWILYLVLRNFYCFFASIISFFS